MLVLCSAYFVVGFLLLLRTTTTTTTFVEEQDKIVLPQGRKRSPHEKANTNHRLLGAREASRTSSRIIIGSHLLGKIRHFFSAGSEYE